MKTVFYWHMHHDTLVEPLTEPIEDRINYIRNYKLENERELRLKLLRPVKGKLPEEVIKAGRKWVKADNACEKARKVYMGHFGGLNRVALFKAERARDGAWNDYCNYLEEHKEDIGALHKKECPDCPWDGYSIFY